jgi:hypothetical protein
MADKLSIPATARGAYAFVWQHRRRFFALAFPAIVVLAILTALVVWLPSLVGLAGEDGGDPAVVRGLSWGEILVSVVTMVVWVMFAVAWHRRYLVPAEAATVGEALRWRHRQTRFLLITFAISLSALLVGFIGGMVVFGLIGGIDAFFVSSGMLAPLMPILISVFGFSCGIFIYARLSLLFPATAVDHRLSLGECFKLTRGNGWRLVIILTLVTAPFWITRFLGLATIAFFGFFAGLTGTLIGVFIEQTLAFAGIAVGVSALSIAYRTLAPPAT